MLIKVKKTEGVPTKALFIFEDENDIPMEVLKFIDPLGYKEKMETAKIEALKEQIADCKQEIADEEAKGDVPHPMLRAKLEFFERMLQAVTNPESCLCPDCKAEAEAQADTQLKDILGKQGIDMN